jgi:hypothetical protein
MDRIGVRDGRFVVRATGRPFQPRGFNYIRLHPRWHKTFSPRHYDGARAARMFADIAARGFNTVRVFIDQQTGDGVVASADAEQLSPKFMGNVIDFLRRARERGIYVVASLIHLPRSNRYQAMLGPPDPQIQGLNRLYLCQGGIDAKARYVADFAAAIRERDASLLPTVLAYELDNETHLDATQPPFSLAEGTVTPANGRTYDLASAGALQRMADENIAHWADTCAGAIRRVDPEALVSTNVFTFAAVGRTGPGRLRSDRTRDPRFPARPLALADTKLDYVDIHFYPFDGETLDRDLRTIEFEAFAAACRRRGKPILMGEFGAFKKAYPALPQAAEAMGTHLERVLALGFAGFLYWTYDTDEQERLWNAKSGRGEILDALERVR